MCALADSACSSWLQAVGIARGLVALPEFMQSKMVATSGFRDELVVCLGTAVMRTFLGQVGW